MAKSKFYVIEDGLDITVMSIVDENKTVFSDRKFVTEEAAIKYAKKCYRGYQMKIQRELALLEKRQIELASGPIRSAVKS